MERTDRTYPQLHRRPHVEGTITFIRLVGFHDRTAHQFTSGYSGPIPCRNELCSGGTISLSDALETMEAEGLLVPGGERSFQCSGRERIGKSDTRSCMHGWKLAITSVTRPQEQAEPQEQEKRAEGE